MNPSEHINTLRKQGFKAFTALEVREHIIGKVFLGSYPPVFKYIIALNTDGSLEGKNDYGHYDVGAWDLNEKTSALTVRWQYGWDYSTVYIYEVDDEFKLMDSTTGNLRTVLHQTVHLDTTIQAYKI